MLFLHFFIVSFIDFVLRGPGFQCDQIPVPLRQTTQPDWTRATPDFRTTQSLRMTRVIPNLFRHSFTAG
jgi:hypothetical protein